MEQPASGSKESKAFIVECFHVAFEVILKQA
jgi:hypothetical protein